MNPTPEFMEAIKRHRQLVGTLGMDHPETMQVMMLENERLLKAWRHFWAVQRREWAAGRMGGPLPEFLHDITCGARTRKGTPCKQRALYWSGRCKWHGGLSTGPTTDAGKEQARINGRKGGRPRKVKP